MGVIRCGMRRIGENGEISTAKDIAVYVCPNASCARCAFVCNAKVPTLVSTFLVTMPERNDSLRPY